MKLHTRIITGIVMAGLMLNNPGNYGILSGDAARSVVFNDVQGLPFENGDPYKGVDVSSVISLENSGVKFYDSSGKEQDIFLTLKDAGVNTVRVRIWNDPYNSSGENYGGGICDINVAVQIAERCAKADLKLLVDFHYSDFWADPGKQKAPKAWESYTVSQKADAIYKFTSESLAVLAKTGVDIAMVQVGNETTTGMCGIMLEDYGWSSEGWKDLSALFNAGSRAVRDFSKNTKVVLHFTNPEKADNMDYLAKMLSQNNVDYDIFATSYYPYWHGTLDNLTNVLTNISQNYGKQVMVAETSWVRTLDDSDGFGQTISSQEKMGDYVSYEISVQGQSDYLTVLFSAVAAVPNGMGVGVFYWEPAWLPVGGNDYFGNRPIWEKYGSGWGNSAASEYDESTAAASGGSCVENESLFSNDGKPLDSLYVFRNIHGSGAKQDKEDNLIANPGFENDNGWTDKPDGWQLRSTVAGHFDVRAEDVHSGGYALHWYSENDFSDSTAATTITAPEDGIYRCSAQLFQDMTGNYKMTAVTSGGESKSVAGEGEGWQQWITPTIEVRVKKGEILTLTMSVSGAAGSYGSMDDCSIEKIADITSVIPTGTDVSTTEPVLTLIQGDVNADGVLDVADLVTFQKWLLAGSDSRLNNSGSADLNRDGRIDAYDFCLMRSLVLRQ